MNHLVHPTMRAALAPAMVHHRTHSADRPGVRIDATPDLKIGRDGVESIKGTVWVSREDGSIRLDDIEVEAVGKDRLIRTIGIGTHHDTMRFRPLTLAEMQEHVIACAFHDLVDEPEFIERAEIALAEAVRP